MRAIGPPPRSDWTRNEDSAKAELNERSKKTRNLSPMESKMTKLILGFSILAALFYVIKEFLN